MECPTSECGGARRGGEGRWSQGAVCAYSSAAVWCSDVLNYLTL